MNDRPRHVLIHRLVTGATILFLASALLAPPAHAAPTWTPVGDLSAAGQSGYGAQVAVVQVVQAGYSIGERVLRPAMVGVAKGGPKAAAPDAPAEPGPINEQAEKDA